VNQKQTRTQRIAFVGLCASLALLLSYVELMLPPIFVAVPGIKVGLPNVIIIYVLYCMGVRYAALVSATRLLISWMLFGSAVTLLYSLAGAILSLGVMAILKKTKMLSTVGVSVAGGVMHNMAQIGMACIIMETNLLTYYAPFLLISGTLAGIAIGVISAIMLKRVDIKIK
jgi:heptaprenyl diphosphate synthase